MDISDSILLGYVARTFGIKGGVVVKLFNEHSDVLVVGTKLIIRPKNALPRLLTIDVTMDSGRVFFSEVSDKTMADELKGAEVFIALADLPPAQDDEFYLVSLMGARVVDTEGNGLGEVVGFSDNNAQTLLEVKTIVGHIASIPAVKPIVQKIDYDNKVITIDPPSGLLEPMD